MKMSVNKKRVSKSTKKNIIKKIIPQTCGIRVLLLPSDSASLRNSKCTKDHFIFHSIAKNEIV